MGALLSSMRTFGADFERPPVYDAGFGATDGVGFLEIADSFFVQTDTPINKVQWWGGSHFPGPNQFTIRFYADNAGLPGKQLFEANVGAPLPTATSINNDDPRETFNSYSATFPSPFVASANSRYWLSIGNSRDKDWGWQISSPGEPYGVMRREVGDSWDNDYGRYGNHAAFALFSVPESGTIPLLALGLVTVAVKRPRRTV
jgi:hypothetical protein